MRLHPDVEPVPRDSPDHDLWPWACLLAQDAPRVLRRREQHGEEGHETWPLGLALGIFGGVTVLVALVSEVFVASVGRRPPSRWDDRGVCRVYRRSAGGGRGGNGVGFFRGAEEPPGPQRRYCAGKRDRKSRCSWPRCWCWRAMFWGLRHDSAVLARRGSDDPTSHPHRALVSNSAAPRGSSAW